MNRSSTVERITNETNIHALITLDGTGETTISTPVGFLSHMLEALARHSAIDIELRAEGDVEIDYHHTVEDTALVLGEAFRKALGEKRGIRRFGHAYAPLDESLARVVIDLSGRPYWEFNVPIERDWLIIHKDFPFALIEEFFKSFASAARITLHADLLRGRNGHHAAEALFKALALALREAVAPAGNRIPSTKGVLE